MIYLDLQQRTQVIFLFMQGGGCNEIILKTDNVFCILNNIFVEVAALK
jgi:hypothetical protein